MNIKKQGKVLEVIREKSSRMGNPKFTAVIQTSNYIDVVTTSPNSTLAYGIQNHIGNYIEYETAIKRNVNTLVSLETLEKTLLWKHIEKEVKELPDEDFYNLQIKNADNKTEWFFVPRHKLDQLIELLSTD